VSAPTIIGLAVVIWVLGIPIAFGFFTKGQWEQASGDDILQGVFWPLYLLILFALMALGGLRIMGVWIIKGLFRFGSWLQRFFDGMKDPVPHDSDAGMVN